MKAQVRTGQVESPNVVAKLEGSDPKLKDRYVVFSRTSIISESVLQ